MERLKQTLKWKQDFETNHLNTYFIRELILNGFETLANYQYINTKPVPPDKNNVQDVNHDDTTKCQTEKPDFDTYTLHAVGCPIDNY